MTTTATQKGFIYILRPFPCNDIIKFGRTIDLERRITQHKKHWPDLQLLVHFRSDDVKGVEQEIKKNTRSVRMGNRELCNVQPSSIEKIIFAFKRALFGAGGNWSPGLYRKQIDCVVSALRDFADISLGQAKHD